MTTVTLSEAQARLAELIDSLVGQEEIVITREDEAVATITRRVPPTLSTEVANARGSGPRSVLELKPISVGKVLKPDFNRAEVWDEMIGRRE